jgi:hypothetical protein
LLDELQEEIELELAQLRQLMEQFRSLRSKTRTHTPDVVETAALASFLHSFYTGLENLFKRIAIHLDEGPPRGEAWHIQLLDKMAKAGKKRPAVISQPLLSGLRSYLDFRHVFRHAYSFELKWAKMAGLVHDCENTFLKLEFELNSFLKFLRSPSD